VRPGRSSRAGGAVLKHAMAPKLCQGVALEVELLVLSGGERIADQHGSASVKYSERRGEESFRAGSHVRLWQRHAGFAMQFRHECHAK